MDLKTNPSIKDTTEHLINSMTEYMKESDSVSYKQQHIDQCFEIVTWYLENMNVASDKAKGMAIVKEAVIKLNQLNETCEHELIETGQREDLCDIIIAASELKGFSEDDDDITEDWREW